MLMLMMIMGIKMHEDAWYLCCVDLETQKREKKYCKSALGN